VNTPADVAALIGGIRAAQPHIGASSIEALFHIAGGADCTAELLERMQITRTGRVKSINMLTGRGCIGRNARFSKLRLVHRRKHPHRRGTQLLLTDEGLALISSTFASQR
jgi:DNA-binding MarR family transcriptional regulator